MADPVVTPGAQTSEGKLAKFVVTLSAVIGVLGTVASFLGAVSPVFASIPAVAPYVGMIGVGVAALTQFAYGLQRTAVKIAAIKAGQAVPSDSEADQAAANLGK